MENTKTETPVLLAKDNWFSEVFFNVLQVITCGIALVILVLFFAFVGFILLPVMLVVYVIDEHIHKDEYENTNRDKK